MFDFLKKFLGLKEKPVEKKENEQLLPALPEIQDEHDMEKKEDKGDLEELVDKFFPKKEQKEEKKEEQKEEQKEAEEDDGYVTNMPGHNLEDSDELNGQLNSDDQEE